MFALGAKRRIFFILAQAGNEAQCELELMGFKKKRGGGSPCGLKPTSCY